MRASSIWARLCSSLFTYCTRVLRLSEHAAYGRIEAARAARRFPVVVERLESGELTLSNLSLLRPHLTDENCLARLDLVRFASKRDVERLVAASAPQSDVAPLIRKLPNQASGLTRAVQAAPGSSSSNAWSVESNTVHDGASRSSDAPCDTRPGGTSTAILVAPAVAPSRPAVVVRALAPGRYKIQFTVNQDTHDKLRRAQDLVRHAIPDGDVAVIFDRALSALLRRRKLHNSATPQLRNQRPTPQLPKDN